MFKFKINSKPFVESIKKKIDRNTTTAFMLTGTDVIAGIRGTIQPKGAKGYFTNIFGEMEQNRSKRGEPLMDDTSNMNRKIKGVNITKLKMLIESTAKDEEGFDYPYYWEKQAVDTKGRSQKRPFFYNAINNSTNRRNYVNKFGKNIFRL